MASEAPFLFFTDHNAELAKAVHDGRRREFASFSQFSDPQLLAKLPEPNAPSTFERSMPTGQPDKAAARAQLYAELLRIRRTEIVPRLVDAHALAAAAAGRAAVTAQWRMGDGSRLAIVCNLGDAGVPIKPPSGRVLFATSAAAAADVFAGQLAAFSTIALLDTE